MSFTTDILMQGLSRRIKYRNYIRIIRDLRTTKRWIFLRVQTGQNKMDEPKNRKIETDRRNIYIVRNLINGAIVFILAVFCYEVEYPDRLYLSLVSSLLKRSSNSTRVFLLVVYFWSFEPFSQILMDRSFDLNIFEDKTMNSDLQNWSIDSHGKSTSRSAWNA